MQDENKIILLTKNYVYSCNSSNMHQWTTISKDSVFRNCASKPVIKGRFAFFADWKNNVHMFNLDSYELITIVLGENL